MKLESVETLFIRLPLRRPHRVASSYNPHLGAYVIVKLHTDEGITGLGEAPTLPEWGGDFGHYYGETPHTVRHVVEELLFPRIRGQSPFAVEQLHHLMDQVIVGHPYAKAAVDIAVFDIIGKALGVPVCQLLGGPFREKVPLADSIGIMDIDTAVTEAVAMTADGIKTIKLKVGLNPERDVTLVREVRQAVGNEVNLTVDANQGYRTPKEAINTLRRMEKYNILFAEQPVEGLEAMSQVTAAVDIPIMADESAWTAYDVMQIARSKAADMISLYISKPGGLWPALKAASVAEAAGLPCNVNGSAEMGVGNAANLHLSAALPIVSLAGCFNVTTLRGREQTRIGGLFYLDDIITEPFKYQDGYLYVPDRPGLGVELDEEKITRYRVDQ